MDHLLSRIHLLIYGNVQGVFYRASTQEQARRLGLTGWVRNCPEGFVELIAEGEKNLIDELIRWCKHGPPRAQVSRVEIQPETFRGEFIDFLIK